MSDYPGVWSDQTSPFITICEPRPEHEHLATAERCAIKACQGVELLTSGELRVVDENDNEVPHDGETLGEIVVRGNAVMKGYFEDPEATANVMRGGWFRTGDAAVVHPNGYAEIRDRLKDVIISGGENISSVEVEGVLLRHPAVQETAIVGLPHERWGEAPHAFVVLKNGAQAAEEELLEFARSNLAISPPHGVTFVSELPKTATADSEVCCAVGRDFKAVKSCSPSPAVALRSVSRRVGIAGGPMLPVSQFVKSTHPLPRGGTDYHAEDDTDERDKESDEEDQGVIR